MSFSQASKGYSFPQILVIDFSYYHFLLNLIPRTSNLNLLQFYPNAVLKCFNFKTHIYSVETGARRIFVLALTLSEVAKLYQNL